MQSLKSVTTFFCFASGYLPQVEIDGLWNFAQSLNCDYWSECKWNFTQLNNTNPDYFIRSKEFQLCGLYLINDTFSDHLQTVSIIDFNFSNHLNGTISDAIASLQNLTSFKLRHNQLLYGNIPSTICDLTRLETLMFQNLSISGSIPFCMQHLSSIKAFTIEQCEAINGTFPEWICKLHNLQLLHFDAVDLDGTIPDCIGTELQQLTFFALFGIPKLRGIFPNSIANLTQLRFFELEYLPQLRGSVDDSLFVNNPNLHTFYFIFDDNALMNISLPRTICKATKLLRIGMAGINTNNSYIPQCIGDLSRLQQLQLEGWSVSGQIPSSICNLHDLWHLEIALTSISGKVPLCVSNMTKLKFIDLHSNQIYGRFPSIYAANLTLIDIHDNSFVGYISEIFQMPIYSELEIIALHDNKLYDDNITSTLYKLFKFSPKLKALSLYKNDYIHGYIPDFTEEISLDLFQAFAAHDLDIYGTLPSHVYFGKNISDVTESALILHNNRLSAAIPPHLQRQSSFNNFRCVIILGNMFSLCHHFREFIPKWVEASSLFVSATNLFIDVGDVIKSYVITIFSLIILVFVIGHRLYRNYISKENIYHPLFFIQDIDCIINKLSDSKLLILICGLLILYPFCNNYYASSPFLTYFCLYFYDFDSNYMDTTLCIFVLLFNVLIAFVLFKFLYFDQEGDGIRLQRLQMRLLSRANIDRNSDAQLKLWIKLLLYFIIYLLCISLTIIYLLTESLPHDNVFKFSKFTQQLITYSVSLVLAFMNAIITPLFISSLNDICQCTLYHRTKIILGLRTLTTIIIPVIFIMYYSNECGSNWTTFWNPCSYRNNKHEFDINVHIHTESFYISATSNYKIHYKGFGFDFEVLSHSDVCEPTDFQNINMDKCLRHYFHGWTQVILNKMIIMIFMPFAIILYKTIPKKIKNWYYQQNKRISICIDSEYTMIVSKLETILAFSVFCPLLIPVTITAIFMCKYFYEYTINKLKWKLTFSNYSDINQYPFGFLWFGFIFQQVSVILFFWYCIESVVLSVFLVVGLTAIDSSLLIYLYCI